MSSKAKPRQSGRMLPIMHPDAAGIDIGAEEIFVSVPPDRDIDSVRRFDTFTRDLLALADWLRECNIRSVAMESTGVYWIPLYQILETHGFEVFLVNAHHVKNVPGRKSDVSDCQWIQYLHSVGLLKASFRPPDEICVLRALWRHREGLVQMAAEHIQHMQKALSQMNLQLHHVLSDIVGVSGIAILDAILAGERDPAKLASLCNRRIRSSRQTVAKSLEGDYRPEHLFALRQSLSAYRFYKQLMAELDLELEQNMRKLPRAEDAPHKRPVGTKKRIYQHAGNEPSFDLKEELFRIAGVDLTDVPGISTLTAHTILMEVGADVSRFRNASAFASWLGLCPEKQVSGGKVLYTRTRKVKNRAAIALRLGAHCLYHAQNYLGDFYRKMKWRLGAPAAVTATAHKLARIVYHLLSTRQPYSDKVFSRFDQQTSVRAEKRLRKQAAELGFQLAPITGTT
ncbi:MAG: IS110 family transposase [Terracidiphilus sp.]